MLFIFECFEQSGKGKKRLFKTKIQIVIRKNNLCRFHKKVAQLRKTRKNIKENILFININLKFTEQI